MNGSGADAADARPVRLSIDVLLDYALPEPAHLLMAVEVAPMADQRLVRDSLTVEGVEPMTPVATIEGVGRRTWMRAQSRVVARYAAIVEVARPRVVLTGLAADPLPELPGDVVPYLFPSRYCESDRFEVAVRREFGVLDGGAKVQAIADWIGRHLRYVGGVTDTRTTAADTFVAHQGVCRDYAHLLIAMVRAADIPARMVGVYAPHVVPQDFHAVAEVWLQGAWHLVDATGMAQADAMVRIGVGRDATDVAFLTIFGTALFQRQDVQVRRID